jgi:hypothetical protein
MTRIFTTIFNSIASAITHPGEKATAEQEAPLKLYTFFIKGEGVRKSVNIKACSKVAAEEKVHDRYPGCTAEFLWELIRSPQH